MNKDSILGFIRHLLTFGGGFFTSGGLATGEQIETAIAAIVTLAGVIWSIVDKKNRAE